MGSISSTNALYAARPRISIDGQENRELTAGLISLLVEETPEGLFRCEATFGNWGADGEVGLLYFDRQILDFGRDLAVQAGDDQAAAQIFSGKITGIEGHFPRVRAPEITVLVEDRFQDLRMARRTRTFEDVSDADVVQQVASQHGLRTAIDMDGPTHRVLAQLNQSDLAFLRERAHAVDAELWVEGDTLHAQARSRRDAGEVALTYGQRLFEFSVLADLARQRTTLSVSGWDVAAKEELEYEAGESALGSELNGFLGGSTLLQQAFGRRKERLVHMAPVTQQEAQAVAEAHYRQMARQFIQGRGVCEGDGRIRVGAHVTLRGLGALFSGEYYVSEVRHTFDGVSGFATHFRVERPGLRTNE
jgi:uncharacterized protein